MAVGSILEALTYQKAIRVLPTSDKSLRDNFAPQIKLGMQLNLLLSGKGETLRGNHGIQTLQPEAVAKIAVQTWRDNLSSQSKVADPGDVGGLLKAIANIYFKHEAYRPLIEKESLEEPGLVFLPPDVTSQLMQEMNPDNPLGKNRNGQKYIQGGFADYIALKQGDDRMWRIAHIYCATAQTNQGHFTIAVSGLAKMKREFAQFFIASADLRLVVPPDSEVAGLAGKPIMTEKKITTTVKTVGINPADSANHARGFLEVEFRQNQPELYPFLSQVGVRFNYVESSSGNRNYSRRRPR